MTLKQKQICINKTVAEMKAYIKEADPLFATDEYLNSISYEDLCDYYLTCIGYYDGPVYDDWCNRLACVRTNNM